MGTRFFIFFTFFSIKRTRLGQDQETKWTDLPVLFIFSAVLNIHIFQWPQELSPPKCPAVHLPLLRRMTVSHFSCHCQAFLFQWYVHQGGNCLLVVVCKRLLKLQSWRWPAGTVVLGALLIIQLYVQSDVGPLCKVELTAGNPCSCHRQG